MNIFFGFVAVFFAVVLIELLNDYIIRKLVRDAESDARLLRSLANKHRKSFDEVWRAD